MASRMFNFGTVLSRMKSLVDCRVAKPPAWLDAVDAHPPLTPTPVNARFKCGRPKEISYGLRDNLMKDFFERYQRYNDEIVSLFEDHKRPTVAEKFVEYQMSLLKNEEMTPESASVAAREHLIRKYGIELHTKEKLMNIQPKMEKLKWEEEEKDWEEEEKDWEELEALYLEDMMEETEQVEKS